MSFKSGWAAIEQPLVYTTSGRRGPLTAGQRDPLGARSGAAALPRLGVPRGRGAVLPLQRVTLLVFEQLVVGHVAQDTGRVSDHDLAGGHVADHDRAGADERFLADLDVGTQHRSAAHPGASADRRPAISACRFSVRPM